MNNQLRSETYLFNNYKRYPISLVRGEGAYAWDEHNKKYLDFLSGIACTPLGHQHPAVTEAIVNQVHKILHTSNLYYSLASIDLAEFLVQHGSLAKVFFCNSGTEANEAAIKLARKYHYRHGRVAQRNILSATHSFHGRTLASLAATAKAGLQEGFGPMPEGFRYADWENQDAFLAAIDSTVAAVILEPVQGEGGLMAMPISFLHAVRQACDSVGALLIFDEVQCGVGRLGTLFAYQYFEVVPDIISMAKGIANGLALGAVCAKASVAEAFQAGDHGSTFGGNPVACAAALATLKTIQSQYLDQIPTLSIYLHNKLEALQKKYPQHISELRGIALMRGICLSCPADKVLENCQKNGLLLNVTADCVLRLLPPYIINSADIDFAMDVLDNALASIE